MGMDCKISITTHCNSMCGTCPVWTLPGSTMSFYDFTDIWDKLVNEPQITHILFSNTGEVFAMSEDNPIRYITYAEAHKGDKYVTMITNGKEMNYVPVGLDKLIISFNGGNKRTYEYTTGMPFEHVVNNIRSQYDRIRMMEAEMHCLIWQGNAGCEDAFKRLWNDFPGKLRLSYKVENQFGPDMSANGAERDERIKCDYLDKLCIAPNGQVIQCAHDFHFETKMGNILNASVPELIAHPVRKRKIIEHERGIFQGLCTYCNYNTPVDGRVVYVGEGNG